MSSRNNHYSSSSRRDLERDRERERERDHDRDRDRERNNREYNENINKTYNDKKFKLSTDANSEIDPLDEFMQTVNHIVEANLPDPFISRNNHNANSSQYPLSDTEDNDDSNSAEISLSAAANLGFQEEDLLAMAQLKQKKNLLSSLTHKTSDIKYEEFKKSFYSETSEIKNMSAEEVRQLRLELDGIKVRGLAAPKPIKKWSQSGLSVKCTDIIKRLNFVKPTPIQAQALPAIMSGRDVIGIAKTGSGKTLAFLLPMFRHILDQRPLQPGDGPIGVVLTPTRELAIQTLIECKKFTKSLGLRAIAASGGTDIREQISDLKRGSEIIIATPGRLIELLCANSGKVMNLQRATYLVLDEADRMFDLGFEPQVMKIVEGIRPDRQTLLFSATFPRHMEGLARRILIKPVEIQVGGRSVVCNDVQQVVIVVEEEEDKFVKLLEILGQWYPDNSKRILIFVDRQDAADILFRELLKKGYPCTSLHGGKDQYDRDSILKDFKNGNVPILVATSVAARGLDVKELNLVINYECPNHLEDYVHRCGRTGRAGNKGTAMTLITPDQERFAPDICRALTDSKMNIPEELTKMATEFKQKVKSGQDVMPGAGFSGHGLDKITATRNLNKKIEKHVYGDDDEVASDDNEEEKKALESQMKSKAAKTSADILRTDTSMQGKLNAAKEKAALIEAQIGIKSKDPLAEYAAKLNVDENSIIPYTTGDGQLAFACEIDINDYPQTARFKVTTKEILDAIMGQTHVGIFSRGSYFPPNKNTVINDRKLHLRIEGLSMMAVEKARKEVRRILNEATLEALSKGSSEGKYTVI